MKKLLSFLFLTLFFVSTNAQELHLYAKNVIGEYEYVGCLTCDNYDALSIWNEYGDYGSKLSATCVFNKLSPYYLFDKLNTPPTIIGSDGNHYGELTTDNMVRIIQARSNGSSYNALPQQSGTGAHYGKIGAGLFVLPRRR